MALSYVCICHYQVDCHKHKRENNTELRRNSVRIILNYVFLLECRKSRYYKTPNSLHRRRACREISCRHQLSNKRFIIIQKTKSLIIEHLKNSLLYGLQTVLTKPFYAASMSCVQNGSAKDARPKGRRGMLEIAMQKKGC